jgi:hypothetical protein
MTFLVIIEYQNFTRIHIDKIILQVLLLFQDSKEQIVHGTKGHNAVYGPVRHQKMSYGPKLLYLWYPLFQAQYLEHINIKSKKKKLVKNVRYF